MKAIEPPDSLDDLRSLRRPGNGIRTSNGRFYGGDTNIWGRDMAITANDLIDIYPEITEEAILTLSSLQGTDYSRRSGEKPGRIHTEYREIYDKNTLGLISKFGLSLTSKILWRNGWRIYTNYFSSDTTPLYIRAVYNFAKKHPQILDKIVLRKNSEQDTVKNCVFKAAEYIESTVDNEGLIQIKEFNVTGNQFRYWRDSPSSYRDENSNLPNISEEMVILDIQALAAEALNMSAELIQNDSPEKAELWRNLSIKIRDATIKNLWMEDRQFFAYGMDQTRRGRFKQLRTVQSNAAWMLYTDFFDKLPDDSKQKYLTGIIKRLFSDEFLTDAGIRCRAKKYIYDRSYQDYHGAWVTWPVESYMFARGLRRQGFDKLAEQIEARIVNAVDISGVNYEFFVADKDDKVLLNPNKRMRLGSTAVALEMRPEDTIAWTVTATLKIKHDRGKKQDLQHFVDSQTVKQEKWATKLENDILNQIYIFTNRLNDDEIDYYLAYEPKIYINRTLGFLQSAQSIIKELGPIIIKQIRKDPFKYIRKT